MGNIDDGCSFLFQLPHYFEQFFCLLFRQGRGGFIHDEYLCVYRQRLCDFYKLCCCLAYILQLFIRLYLHAQTFKCPARYFLHLFPVQLPMLLQSFAYKQILQNG